MTISSHKPIQLRRRDGHPAQRVTLDDLARESGFHRTTVSQVLNDHPNCWASEATRKQILRVADELGYRPNLAARALRSGQSHVIGLISPGFLIYSPDSRADGLMDAACQSNYTVTLSATTNDAASEDRTIRRMLDRGIDGLAIYPVDPGPHKELRRLVESAFPVVTFEGANVLDFQSDDISVDCDEVGRLQVRHLLALGRERICLANRVSEPRMARVTAVREAAIRDELARVGAAPPLEMRLPLTETWELPDAARLKTAMRGFIEAHAGAFDGIIGGDATGAIAVRLLHELGLRVPDDVAVIGGGGMLATYCEVPLTSVNARNDEAGRQAFDLIMDRIQGRAGDLFRRLTNPARLIVRESTHNQPQ